MASVKEIIVKFLDDNGFDGLVNGDIECGCSKLELAPCRSDCMGCEPAYISKTPQDGFDLWFTTEKK